MQWSSPEVCTQPGQASRLLVVPLPLGSRKFAFRPSITGASPLVDPLVPCVVPTKVCPLIVTLCCPPDVPEVTFAPLLLPPVAAAAPARPLLSAPLITTSPPPWLPPPAAAAWLPPPAPPPWPPRPHARTRPPRRRRPRTPPRPRS